MPGVSRTVQDYELKILGICKRITDLEASMARRKEIAGLAKRNPEEYQRCLFHLTDAKRQLHKAVRSLVEMDLS